MPRGNHAKSIASNGDQREDKKLLQHLQLSQGGEIRHVSVVNNSDHGRVVRIFVCLSRGLYCHRVPEVEESA